MPDEPTTKVVLNEECTLRQWCLERAFETRALMKVNHMVVTNVAEEYYRWIVEGESQSSRQFACEPDETQAGG